MNILFKKTGSFIVLVLSLILLSIIPIANHYAVLEDEESESTLEKALDNKARADYFFNMTRDPNTNTIPNNARARELDFSNNISSNLKARATELFNWVEAGPNVVGGRTRAFALDIADATGNTMLAGGASGGIWKSTDGGNSWTQTSDPNENLSVTSLAQDPTNTNIWYYTAGEFDGNSARGKNGPSYFGTGIWKSTNGGDSWTNLTASELGVNDAFWNSAYDFITNVKVSPANGHVFVATNGFGLFRSTDGINFNNIYGAPGAHRYLDFDIDSQGNIIMIASENTAGGTGIPGVFYSTTNGTGWTNVTPNTFPQTYTRSVVDFAPSNENIAYIFTNTGTLRTSTFDSEEDVEVLALHKVNVSNSESTDLSANIPEFGVFRETVVTQGDYNMTVAVSPTDESFVLLGGVSLYRSFDGFATAVNSTSDWIGGYTGENHHPDNHALFFDPNSPDKLWSAHDGGISVTNNIKSPEITWVSKDEGYNVTQFYTVAIPRNAGDTRIVGGTQDNGSPYFRLNDPNETENDISSGDGSFAYIGENYMYVSSQRGFLVRVGIDNEGEPLNPFTDGTDWSVIYPNAATQQRFIHPFEVNPSNENVIAYPDGGDLFITTQAESFPNFDNDGVETGWAKTTIATLANHVITALSYTETNPSNRLYIGASAGNEAPKVLRWDSGAQSPVEINIPGAESGANVNDIAVNPLNGDELVVVLSNYSVKGIYYSSNAGQTWTSIEGNLEGNESELGPSIRSAAIVEGSLSKVFVVGTSVGVYSTNLLNGDATVWTKEGTNVIGSSIAEHIDYRSSDYTLAVGTHGRGIFIGTANNLVSNEEVVQNEVPSAFTLKQNYPNPFNPTTNISYSLPASARVTISVYDVNGRKVSTLVSGQQKNAGEHELTFDAGNLASGIYLYRISAISNDGRNSFSDIKKMTLIK